MARRLAAPRITDRRRKPRAPAWQATRVQEGSLAAALTVEAVEEAIGVPAIDWDGYEAARGIVEKRLVDGRPVRGWWTGPVDPASNIRDDARGRIPHGWILTPMGFVVDATRWMFEQTPPYIYEGPADYYEEERT